ncbi:MAG: hypothetical protein R6X16_12730 [Anaerolineae bacterium]
MDMLEEFSNIDVPKAVSGAIDLYGPLRDYEHGTLFTWEVEKKAIRNYWRSLENTYTITEPLWDWIRPAPWIFWMLPERPLDFGRFTQTPLAVNPAGVGVAEAAAAGEE